MALLATEGFNHYGDESHLLLRCGFLQWQNDSIITASLTVGRNGVGQGILLGYYYGASLRGVVGGNYETLTYGFWLQRPGSGSAFQFSVGETVGGVHGYVEFVLDNGTVSYHRADGTQIAITTNNQYNAAVGTVVEIQYKVGSTHGAVSVRLMGHTVLQLTDINTQSTSSAYQNFFRFWCGTSGASPVMIDDFRLCDTVVGPGTYPCDGFLGDVRVATSFTTGNADVQFSPLANTNYVEVGGLFRGDASYNYPTAVGQSDLFVVGSLPPSVSLVIGVQITGAYRATDAAPHTMTSDNKTNGVLHHGDSISLTGTYGFYPQMYAVNPVTGISWTVADLAATKIGYTAQS